MTVKAVKGMNDILPESTHVWLWLENIIQQWLSCYCYEQIRTPVVESTTLFLHTVGHHSDIVQKEMYSWQDCMNGDLLSLRPEGTAPCLRATLEHNLLYNAPQKLWYIGPMFRHERPQKGRYRQFNQLGVETLGFDSADAESELIIMLNQLWKILGISQITLHINCLGNEDDRILYRSKLQEYVDYHLLQLKENNQISPEQFNELSNTNLHNPLRILDSKMVQLASLIKNAPIITDYLSEKSLLHYQSWKQSLDTLNITYVENPHLVRGLDYYNLSVFEWVSEHLGAQSTVCGGGRYDALFSLLENKTTANRRYAAGFAIGLERLILILEEMGLLPQKIRCDFYICSLDSTASTFTVKILDLLHNNTNFKIMYNYDNISLKSHLKKAEQLNAKFCIFIGINEASNQMITIKNMLNRTQDSIKEDNFITFLQNLEI
jgi:histidyl-tRNA synthetase